MQAEAIRHDHEERVSPEGTSMRELTEGLELTREKPRVHLRPKEVLRLAAKVQPRLDDRDLHGHALPPSLGEHLQKVAADRRRRTRSRKVRGLVEQQVARRIAIGQDARGVEKHEAERQHGHSSATAPSARQYHRRSVTAPRFPFECACSRCATARQAAEDVADGSNPLGRARRRPDLESPDDQSTGQRAGSTRTACRPSE